MFEQNETEQLMLNHRSIRQFKDTKLTDERVETLLTIAQHTATSHFMQSYSVIRIKNQKQLAKMSSIGNHQFTAGEELVIFIVDQKRNVEMAQAAGQSIQYLINFDRFLGGVFDASLAAQSFALAAESEGLGSLIMGSFLDDVESMIAVLSLPKYTFPVLGVVIGEPLEVPKQKPRLVKPLFQMTDKYEKVSDYDFQISKYDEMVQEYYDRREGNPRQEKFSDMISRFASHGNPKRDEIAKWVQAQGFNLNIK